MAEQNPWDAFPVASGGPLPSPPKTPTPLQVAGHELNVRAENRQEGNVAHDNAVTDTNQRINNPQSLRKEFDTLPEVKAYKVSAQQLAQALSTGDGPQADLALTYAFAKVMDPDSVVRESEQASVAGSQPWLDAKVESVKKQFHMDGAGNYTPEARARLRQQIIRAVASRDKIYNQKRTQFSEYAKRNNIDPYEVVGDHAGEVYRQQFRAYDDKRREAGADLMPLSGTPGTGTTPDGGTAVSPEMRGGFPVGTQVEMGFDKQEGPFDRERYLKEHFGVTPDQEALIIGFWNANRGNQSLTPQAVNEWYAKNGLPAPTDPSAGIASAKKGLSFSGFDTTGAEKAYRDKLQTNLNEQGFDPNSGGAYGERLVQGAEMGLSDEVEGVLGGAKALFTNKPVGDAYVEARDTARLAAEEKQKAQGLAGNVLEFAGGVATGLKIPGGGGVMGGLKSGAGAGALAGFGYGEGLQGSLQGGAIGGVTGGAIGAGAGKVGDLYLARRARLANVAEGAMGDAAQNSVPPAPSGSQVMEAADRQGITMLPADVGGRGTRMASGAVNMTLGGIPLADAAEKAVGTAAAARNRVAGELGRVGDDAAAGQAAQRGANSFIDASEKRATEFYEKISVPNKATAVSENTRAALTEVTRGMESNPELSAIWTGHPRLKATLEALTPEDRGPAVANIAEKQKATKAASDALGTAKADLARLEAGPGAPGMGVLGLAEGEMSAARQAVASAQKEYDAASAALKTAQAATAKPPREGSVSWEDMKRLRSIVGQIVGKPGIEADGATEAAMRKLYGALTADMQATAAQTSPRALTEFNRATQYFRGRQDRIENVLSGILGNDLHKGAEGAFAQINRWAQTQGGDFQRLSQAIRSLPREEADTVRATLIGKMGKAQAGRQNAAGTVFSPAEFSTQWNKLSPRAKSILFPDKVHRAAIDDIAVATSAMKRAEEYANTSKTALATNAMAHLTGVAVAPFTTAMLAATEFGLGKVLASPKLARWLARAKDVREPAFPNYVAKLGTIASENAGIAADARGLQEALQRAFSQSPQRAAAVPESQDVTDSRRVPVQ